MLDSQLVHVETKEQDIPVSKTKEQDIPVSKNAPGKENMESPNSSVNRNSTGGATWGDMQDGELRQLASEALRGMASRPSGVGMNKETSSDILDKYNRQPLSVRSRAEQWELMRSEIRLGEKVGEGDGGVIVRATWRGLDVCAKMLKAEQHSDGEQFEYIGNIEESVARMDLINEISVLSRLRHPNLVMFLGACTIGKPMVILNEFMSGGNLEDFLLKQRAGNGGKPWIPPAKLTLRWSLELARALCFLHTCNPTVIHRDLKPANLLLNEDAHLKVGDFGLSKVTGLLKVSGTYRMTGKTGSMRYMAPEVFQDDPHYNEKVDIYSTGLILWYIAMGERPFDRVAAEIVAEQASMCNLRPNLDGVKSKWGPEFAALIEKCWQALPEHRPSAPELVEILEAWGDKNKDKIDKGGKKKDKNCCVM